MGFEISKVEYEIPRTSFELIVWLQGKFRQMNLTGNFDEIYLERKGLNVKKLIEEAVPVSRLALHLSTSFQNATVKLRTGNQNYDAEIQVNPTETFEHFKGYNCKVEVSTTETEETTMRRQALSRQGMVPLIGDIKRNKRDIISEVEFIDTANFEDSLVSLLFERLQRKIQSQKYDKETVILIHLSDFNPISIHGRAKLIRKTRAFLVQKNPKVRDVYFTYTFANVIDAVKFYER